MKSMLPLLVAILISAGCATSPWSKVTVAEIAKKQAEIDALEEEISIVLSNLHELQSRCVNQTHNLTPSQESKRSEYSFDFQSRDLDLTIRTLSECKSALVKQLKEFRRKHDVPVVDLE